MATDLTHDDLALFCIRLAPMVTVHVPLVEALHLVGDEYEELEIRQIAFKIRDEVAIGTPLADACRTHSNRFDDELWRVLTKGEESGELALTLNRVAGQQETLALQASDSPSPNPDSAAPNEQSVDREGIAAICRQLSADLRSGISLTDALGKIAESSDVEAIKHLVSKLRKAVLTGEFLADACAANPESFDEISCVILRVADSSDEVAISLETIASYQETIAHYYQARR